MFNEFLTMQAFQALLPKDDVAEVRMDKIVGVAEDETLIVRRFDRDKDGQRIHFEEFNQLLGFPSKAKYDGAHKDTNGITPPIAGIKR